MLWILCVDFYLGSSCVKIVGWMNCVFESWATILLLNMVILRNGNLNCYYIINVNELLAWNNIFQKKLSNISEKIKPFRKLLSVKCIM